MHFYSHTYIFYFLPLVIAVYFAVNHFKHYRFGNLWLVLASFVFYAWWGLDSLPVLVISILMNFILGKLIMSGHGRVRIGLLCLGLGANILCLEFYKFADETIRTANLLFGTSYPLLNLHLPLAISFFSLTQIAYIIDCYQGSVKRQTFLGYISFVVFFPHLIIGPLVHHAELVPQFFDKAAKRFNFDNLLVGASLFFIGLAKKLLIADYFAGFVDPAFDLGQPLHFWQAWQTSIGFTLQLYFDFSGYTDMAVASALMLNIKLPPNFDSPFRATSLIQFWSKWHMSLTNFLTTYIYTPILRFHRRGGFKMSMMAIFLTFFISGFWHGARWTYILFGFLHGAALMTNHIFRRKRLQIPRSLGWLLTFLFVNATFTIFRAPDLTTVGNVLGGMIGLNGLGWPELTPENIQQYLAISLCFVLTLWVKNSLAWAKDVRTFLNSGGEEVVWKPKKS